MTRQRAPRAASMPTAWLRPAAPFPHAPPPAASLCAHGLTRPCALLRGRLRAKPGAKGTPGHRLIDSAFAGDYKTVGAILKEVAPAATAAAGRMHACVQQCTLM